MLMTNISQNSSPDSEQKKRINNNSYEMQADTDSFNTAATSNRARAFSSNSNSGTSKFSVKRNNEPPSNSAMNSTGKLHRFIVLIN